MKKHLIILALVIPFLATNCKLEKRKSQEEGILVQDSTYTEKAMVRLYGLPVDSFEIIEGKVKRNQFLGDILSQYDVPYESIHKISLCPDSIFSVKRIRRGNKYTVFCSKDSTKTIKCFVYEQSPIDYVVVDFSDSLNIYKQQKEIQVRERTASGEIKTSLWEAMTENDISPMLSIELSDIYAWSIDFFGLQKGDYFKIIYEEQCVDSQSIGIGKIKGVCFNHMGKDFYAIPFTQDSARCFFDEEGKSLRKAFLKAPLRFSRISSRFSHSRLHPILKIRRPHHGIDYAAPLGTPVYAIGDGVVIKKGYSGGAGHMLKIKHNSVYTTGYLHLSRYGKGIKKGVYVNQGDLIGYVGSTGCSTGPHLDFRFYKNGSPVNPLKVDAPPVDPIKEENLAQYDEVKNRVVEELEKI